MKAIERKAVSDYTPTAAEQRRVDRSNILSEYEKLIKQNIADALSLIKDNKSTESRSRKSASIYSKASRGIKASNDSPYEPAAADAPHVSFKKPNSRPPSVSSNQSQPNRYTNKEYIDDFQNTNRQNSSTEKFINNSNDRLENVSSNSSPDKTTRKNRQSNSSSGTGIVRRSQQQFSDNDSVSSGIFDSAGEYENKNLSYNSPKQAMKQPEPMHQRVPPKKSESQDDISDDDQLGGIFANNDISDDEEYEVELNTDTRKAEIEKNKRGRLIY